MSIGISTAFSGYKTDLFFPALEESFGTEKLLHLPI